MPRTFMYACSPLIIMPCIFYLVGCHHASIKPTNLISSHAAAVTLTERAVDLVLVPQSQRIPPYITYQKQDRYILSGDHAAPLKLDMAINPTMRNVNMKAHIEK